MDYLIQLDKYLFRQINNHWHTGIADSLMPFIRQAHTWYPFYIFLCVFVFSNFRKNTWWWLVFAAGTAVLTNFISSDIIKENIFRLRPCNDPLMEDGLRVLVNYRPQSSSFTSSHATNHFGLAMFLHMTLKKFIGRWTYGFFAWATIIIYAQVYVGVHYPADVAGGAVIGMLFGYLTARSYNNQYGLS